MGDRVNAEKAVLGSIQAQSEETEDKALKWVMSAEYQNFRKTVVSVLLIEKKSGMKWHREYTAGSAPFSNKKALAKFKKHVDAHGKNSKELGLQSLIIPKLGHRETQKVTMADYALTLDLFK